MARLRQGWVRLVGSVQSCVNELVTRRRGKPPVLAIVSEHKFGASFPLSFSARGLWQSSVSCSINLVTRAPHPAEHVWS